MVKFVVNGNTRTDQAGGGLGWLSFQFQLGASVTGTSSTGFSLVRDISTPIPGAPPIPDPAPDVYSGTDLQFTDITLFGTTLATPSSGLITDVTETGADFTSTATGLNIDAADFFRVSATESNRDNVQLLKQVFSGRDEFQGGGKRDKFNGFGGNDKIDGRQGNDKLWGGGGRDKILGGRGADSLIGGGGRDTLSGGKGDDTLVGSAGNDRLTGGGGDDRLEGGKGNDILRGQSGRDVFVFNGGNLGSDTIENWSDGKDRIEIDYHGVTSFADLTLTSDGNDLEITYGSTSILILGGSNVPIDASDFIF